MYFQLNLFTCLIKILSFYNSIRNWAFFFLFDLRSLLLYQRSLLGLLVRNKKGSAAAFLVRIIAHNSDHFSLLAFVDFYVFFVTFGRGTTVTFFLVCFLLSVW